MMLHVCTKCHENILDSFSYRADMIFMGKASKGHNSTKNVDEVSGFVL